MTKTFCDRCEKEMTKENEYDFAKFTLTINRNPCPKHPIAGIEKCLILCEDCAAALMDFFGVK